MSEVSATDAARNFSELLDAIEHRGEQFTIVRRGKAVASLRPLARAGGAEVKELLRRQRVDDDWADELAAVRSLVEFDDRR